MKLIKLTKLKDNTFNNNHPNQINEGFTITGIADKVKVGERFYVGKDFSTSRVKKIIDENTFETMYSTYKIEFLQ